MQQPIFLELEAPLKICGNPTLTQETFTDNILIYSDSLTMENTLLRLTICF